MRVIVKTFKMQRRMAKSLTEVDNPPSQSEPFPTNEKAAKSFEENTKTKA